MPKMETNCKLYRDRFGSKEQAPALRPETILIRTPSGIQPSRIIDIKYRHRLQDSLRLVLCNGYRTSYFPSSCARITLRRILSLVVLGRAATASTVRGYLYGAVVRFTWFQFPALTGIQGGTLIPVPNYCIPVCAYLLPLYV